MTETQAIQAVIDLALSEVGYHEKASAASLDSKTGNSGSGNYTKYGKEMHSVQPSNMNYPDAWCFTEGTYVLTDKGYKPIEEIVEGDCVLNAYGTQFNTVIKTMSREADVVKFRAYGALPLMVTQEHPFLCAQRLGVRKDGKYSDLDFRGVKELKPGDDVVIPQTANQTWVDLSHDEAWIIGYFVGDGWKTSRGKYRLCGNDEKEKLIYSHILDITKDRDYPSRTCNEYEIDIEKNSNIIPYLDGAGVGAENKKVPTPILFAQDDIKQAFLDGYLSADGTKEQHFSTVSKALAVGISKIAFDLGYGCSVRECFRNETQQIYDARTGKIREINIKPIIYVGKVNTSDSKQRRLDRISGGLVRVPVKETSTETQKAVVYNVTVDGDHTYLANNLAVHNCDTFVDWLFYHVFGRDLARKMLCGDFDDYTVNSAQLYKNAGRWVTVPKKGYQIFFQNGAGICHTGIVYKVAAGTVYTVEGNSSDMVAKRTYDMGSSRIAGYGMPKYSLAANIPAMPVPTVQSRVGTCTVVLGEFVGGCVDPEIKTIQTLLNWRGYKGKDGKKLAVDGELGPNTMYAIETMQKKADMKNINFGTVSRRTWLLLIE